MSSNARGCGTSATTTGAPSVGALTLRKVLVACCSQPATHPRPARAHGIELSLESDPSEDATGSFRLPIRLALFDSEEGDGSEVRDMRRSLRS